ncbi:MAG: hypothetical protein ACSLFR_09590 [Solirubrobacteraceae bacterium]
MPTAFVLAGGASLGAIEAGMVEALYERGIAPDYLVGGRSGGACGASRSSPGTRATTSSPTTGWRAHLREARARAA